MEKRSGPIIVCPAKFENQHSRMAIKQLAAKKNHSTKKKKTTTDIQVTFGAGAQNNPEFQAAFRFAMDIWAEELVSLVPIRISADFRNLSPGALASAGPTQIAENFTNALKPDVFYPIALANSMAGELLNPNDEFDLIVNIGAGIPWYFGTDGNTPIDKFDLVTVALHEIGHGLGFVDSSEINNGGVASIGFNGSTPSIFDTFMVDQNNNSVLDLPNPSTELASFLSSGNVFVNGPLAIEALNGNLPELFAPNPFQGGSSIAHWDENVFPTGDPNSLMSPQLGPSESNFNIGPLTLGYFRDMGWVLNGQPILITPNSIKEELSIEETITKEITVTNIADTAVTVTALTPSEPYLIIENISPEEIEIPAGTSATITVTLSTVGVPKDIYKENIEFRSTGFDDTLNVSINVEVFDGTEVASIAVTPDTFNETIEQLKIVQKELTIENTGNKDLTYDISISDQIQSSFRERVALTNTDIATNGYTVQQYPSSLNKQSSFSIIKNKETFNKLPGTIYSTDFENFNLEELDQQDGWTAQPTGFFTISDSNAFDGTKHARGTTDGSGVAIQLLSPVVSPENEPFMAFSAQLNIQSNGSDVILIPQSISDNKSVTEIRFNADKTIDVLDIATNDFIPTGFTIPDGYFQIVLSVDRDDSSLAIFMDNTMIFSGTASSNVIEQVVIQSNNATSGSTFDIDNFEIIDGEETLFLLVTPSTGIIEPGKKETLEVDFITLSLDKGVYETTITINSNDIENPAVEIPVNLTVIIPPTINVTPDSLNASVDVTIDDPAIKTDSFTVSNTGDNPLEFIASLGPPRFTLPAMEKMKKTIKNLDMSKYGVGNTEQSSYITSKLEKKKLKVKSMSKVQESATTFIDSIFYDPGTNFPDIAEGFVGAPTTSAVKFDAELDFLLTAVRNAYITENVTEVAIILEIYRGGSTPVDGELLLQQVITKLAPNALFAVEELIKPLFFSAGESFWVVHKYPETIQTPQGSVFNTTGLLRPDTYFTSSDGGMTYRPDLSNEHVMLKRALSAQIGEPYITLEPSMGTIAPGENIEVGVTFDGTNMANGVHKTDIRLKNNDPVNPIISIPTTFEVSGQVNGIEISEEYLLFDNLFIGNTKELTFTITNTGFDQLTITEIVSDNEDFIVEPNTAILGAQEELEVKVAFTPITAGSSNGIISINSDASNNPSAEVILNGIGVDPPIAILSPRGIFEATDEGTTIDTEITIRNTGNSPLIYSFPDIAVASALSNPDIEFNNTSLISFKNFNATATKNFVDKRIGHPAEKFNIGKDTKYGYSWIDSDEEGGPIYSLADISATGTNITEAVGTNTSAEISLPFPVKYYGITYNTIYVNANGFVSFQEPMSDLLFNRQIPVDDVANNIIAGLWIDFSLQLGDAAIFVEPTEDQITFQWSNIRIFGTEDDETVSFRIIIFKNGIIEFLYDDVNNAPYINNTTVGIENAAGDDGALVAFNTPYVKDRLAVRFIPPIIANVDFISNVSSISGVVPANSSKTLTATLDATKLEPGVYLDTLILSSNSPDKTLSTSVAELTVNNIPEVVGFSLINADTNELIGVIHDKDTINFKTIGSNKLNIVANTDDSEVGSVVFDYNTTNSFSIENTAPYTIGGDTDGNYDPLNFQIGANTITATPYVEKGGKGKKGISNTIDFEVISGTEILKLVNADTNELIGDLSNGDILDLNDYPSTGLSIIAETTIADVKSVIFDFNGTPKYQIENIPPYALNGDNTGTYKPVTFPSGANTITASIYGAPNGKGNAMGEITVNFEVISQNRSQSTSSIVKVYPNPVTTTTRFLTIENDKQQVLKATMFNMLGQVIYSFTDFKTKDNGNIFLDISNLAKGTYILRLDNDAGEKISQVKIIKQ
ncbi:choice-of-anchor D domain-containing protein [Aquimarina sp. RZ0]|uniref:Ig-like domain-containing protein n=1 Tax=Aquimarina sp. RZ0 TaxID=2607730 RepID=UPI00165FCB2B|nr:choice-of-anchor D domain-containing protein [Aquimarina sp. RZ0]